MIPTRWQAVRWTAPTAAVGAALLAAGCGDPAGPDLGAIDPILYSQHVQPILSRSCNTSACHNEADKAAGLSLTGHAALAAGSRYGAMIVPYFPERSHFWLHLTGAIEPRMPLARTPLDPDVIEFLRRWIAEGAPDDTRAAMYSDATRRAFVACQGDNTVAVVDMDTGLAVRHLTVDQPHSVHVDPVARKLYVSRFETASDNLHVYDADSLELLATGRGGTFPALLSVARPAGGTPGLWVTNFDGNLSTGDHAVRVLDPATLAPIRDFTLPSGVQPHGIARSADHTRLYVCNIASGSVTVFGTDPPRVLEFPVAMPPSGMAHLPQQCVLSADETHLFVSALNLNRVYVMDVRPSPPVFVESATVDVGDGPWHLSLRPGGDELWVANWRGNSVSVVDVSDPSAPAVVATLAPMHPIDADRPALQRPIGISFSPDGSQVYVASANDDESGTGHHPTPDGERAPGNVAVFDAATRQVLTVAEVPSFARFVSFLP